MNPPPLPEPARARLARGFFNPAIVKAAAFYTIALCILAGVVVSILAIWDFTKTDTLWRFGASFLIVAAGTLLFAFVNGVFGDRDGD